MTEHYKITDFTDPNMHAHYYFESIKSAYAFATALLFHRNYLEYSVEMLTSKPEDGFRFFPSPAIRTSKVFLRITPSETGLKICPECKTQVIGNFRDTDVCACSNANIESMTIKGRL